MLERFAEEDRLEQMNMQVWRGRACSQHTAPLMCRDPGGCFEAWHAFQLWYRQLIAPWHLLLMSLPQKRRAKQAAHMREVERLLAYRRQLYLAMQVRAAASVPAALAQ
jgi:hypothetical protein